MPRILSMRQVCEKTSLARASIYRKIDPKDTAHYDETFPKPTTLSDPRVNTKGKLKGQLQKWVRLGFLEEAIDKWIVDRFKKRAP